jgi:ribosome biogenesis GTPase / thiamine phosphate phosphatase
MPRRRTEQDSNWTRRFQQDQHDADYTSSSQQFSNRSKYAREVRMKRTAEIRAAKQVISGDIESLPLGQIIQVHSLFAEVLCEDKIYLAVSRRTHQRMSDSSVIVGDLVRFRPTGTTNEAHQPEASIELILPRKTLLLRQNSFRKDLPAPIVANAVQMLIVVSILQPRPKWGLIDRMLIAAESGGLKPIVCLNKLDLATDHRQLLDESAAILTHYQSLGVTILQTSIHTRLGLDALQQALLAGPTVLAGHSGVGKSSLINAIAPGADIRVGVLSAFNEKGRHTTTSARRYLLPSGAIVIDTPGVRQFGLANITHDSLLDYFPDVAAETAPDWRKQSYQHILASL